MTAVCRRYREWAYEIFGILKIHILWANWNLPLLSIWINTVVHHIFPGVLNIWRKYLRFFIYFSDEKNDNISF